ncbi:hypothetical protein KC19_4G068300 [Ceratodon purpureus]|uniref:Uncharacterized protein n=1 Tax=Ceratodon purpureus TaxID=3225 RepID=A0A8T0I7L7_CERPU|nr:hypothetical protein KC19_4G068300 [Ceratodon purpureus]
MGRRLFLRPSCTYITRRNWGTHHHDFVGCCVSARLLKNIIIQRSALQSCRNNFQTVVINFPRLVLQTRWTPPCRKKPYTLARRLHLAHSLWSLLCTELSSSHFHGSPDNLVSVRETVPAKCHGGSQEGISEQGRQPVVYRASNSFHSRNARTCLLRSGHKLKHHDTPFSQGEYIVFFLLSQSETDS